MRIDSTLQTWFHQQLYDWFEKSDRPLPWKNEKDPYLIWLSEIILQQTRVEQGLPYYERFKANFPTVQSLAKATEDEVFKLWEGLGYYSRARNMHFTAKFIAHELEGVFPSTYEQILGLKGVGPYTAAAIASFAFNLPYAVLDGNVYRVLARFLGIENPIDTSSAKKVFSAISQNLLDKENPALYNQAMMDFGATHCMPKKPKCTLCPLKERCEAFRQDKVLSLPVKSKKLQKKQRYFHYFILNFEGKVFLQKRANKDIWKGLYQFPLFEHNTSELEEEILIVQPFWQELIEGIPYFINSKSKPFQQVLTHQKIVAVFWEIHLKQPLLGKKSSFLPVERQNLRKFAFPKIIDWYLGDNSLYLKLI